MMVLTRDEMVRDLYHRVGFSGQEVADCVGVSRERVYQVARAAHTSLDREWTSGCSLVADIYMEEGYPIRAIARMMRRTEEMLRKYYGPNIPKPTKRWAVESRQVGVIARGYETREEAEAAMGRLSRNHFQVARL